MAMKYAADLERQKAGSTTYVILLTGKGGKEDIVKGLEAGADDYLVKPFDNDQLRARVAVGRRVIELQSDLAAKENLRGSLKWREGCVMN